MFPWRMPDAWGTGADLVSLRESLVAGARTRSLLLFAVVVLVLLIAVAAPGYAQTGPPQPQPCPSRIGVPFSATGSNQTGNFAVVSTRPPTPSLTFRTRSSTLR